MKQREILNSDVFNWNLEAYESGKYRVIANQGSTRSTKTYSITQLLALYIAHKYKKSISIVSPSLPHLKRGARRDFLEIIETAGIYSDDRFNMTDQIYTYPNGSYIEFFGAEDMGRVRGPGRDILYVNEANLLSFPVYKQLALRTKEIIFIDFNPVDEMSWVYEVADAPGNLMIHSTYLNNPFLPKEQVQEIEGLREIDQNMWKVFGLGLRGQSSELIYTHWRQCDRMPEKGEVFYGMDFGFNNPSAVIKIEIFDGIVYLDEVLYQTRLTTNDLIDELLILGIHRSDEIYADSAEPKTIEEIQRAGYNVKPADKAENSVMQGIRKVKSMPLRVTSRSTNIIKEFKGYKWKTDKDGVLVTPEKPVKFMDHAMDAVRYGLFTKLTEPAATWVAF